MLENLDKILSFQIHSRTGRAASENMVVVSANVDDTRRLHGV